mmetsp:Transcript_15195/g.52797  ORF Transcript_15195/g.52797 Transcript_15195/m.52797 type:complete len:214 (-) Transcript_15195:1861-2502(-)
MIWKSEWMLFALIAARHADTTRALAVPTRSRAAFWIMPFTSFRALSSSWWLWLRFVYSPMSSLLSVYSSEYMRFISFMSPRMRASSALITSVLTMLDESAISAVSFSRIALYSSTRISTSWKAVISAGNSARDSSSCTPRSAHIAWTISAASSMSSVRTTILPPSPGDVVMISGAPSRRDCIATSRRSPSARASVTLKLLLIHIARRVARSGT